MAKLTQLLIMILDSGYNNAPPPGIRHLNFLPITGKCIAN